MSVLDKILKTVLILTGCVLLAGSIIAIALGKVALFWVSSVFTVGVWWVVSRVGDYDDRNEDGEN